MYLLKNRKNEFQILKFLIKNNIKTLTKKSNALIN